MPDGITGIVTSIRHAGAQPVYNIVTKEDVLQARCDIQLMLNQAVAVAEGNAIPLRDSTSSEYNETVSALLKRLGSTAIQLSGTKYSGIAEEMLPAIRGAANKLLAGFVTGAPIVVRFHNDGDGSAGGIALYRALSAVQEKLFPKERSVSWQMNKGISYTLESFYADKLIFDSYESVEKPIVVIIDFGTAQESVDAIKAAHGSCEIIWLDHHVPYDGFPKEMIGSYINPFDFGGDSNFTAGLLGCIFAQLLCNVNVEDLKDAALVSDFSAYADFGNENALKESIILDYLTSSGNDAYTKPKHMHSILADKERSESTFRHASGMLEEAITTGMKKMLTYRNAAGTSIHVLDFNHIAKLGLDYPLPGRYTSKLQEKLESRNGGNTITVVHYGNYISIRCSKDMQKSFDILDIIGKLKESTNGEVSGGGHRQAASIRASKERLKEVTRMLLLELGISA